ncbi:MAG TPA: CaiB/BaiF CoA-transferase family protein [Alphaproteobacteria bacterium]|nr:CoA transferase [Alphaproteobacteria bacterium]USO04870.1 MAG: CoA transferase [Rhodospirillales bacterium]HOO81866.1 CaiB/BaiF CoA-transferase family protein [Alphaproteobacteria bacterium]
MNKALHNIRILDLSRVLAGPYCTQMLGDLGAEILKVEKPGSGDDTRKWGPPFLQNGQGSNTSESAYYLSCNRNKKSIAIDLTTPKGQEIVKSLIAQCDIVIENFKVGGLKKYGLDYESLKKDHPALIYCSITGFGQTGPLAREPGYDFLAQAMTGLMACTGDPDGAPMKVGVALGDVMTGLNAAVGILAALYHRRETGQGQYIDLALGDCTLAALTNIAQYYLTSGRPAPRVGNAHSTIVPYQAFKAADGYVILAVGNNEQFQRFCDFAGHSEWAEDERFATNSARVLHRETLVPMIETLIARHDIAHWIDGLHDADVPCGPVNTMDKVFGDPQISARDMKIEMEHPLTNAPVHLVGSPLKLSGTPVTYKYAPPVCGQHTREILSQQLRLSDAEIDALAAEQIIQIVS